MVIDAHAHLIPHVTGTIGKGEILDLGNGEVAWMDGTVCRIIPSELYHDGFTMDTLITQMDRFGIGKAVLMQAYYYGIHNRYVAQAVEKYPDRFIGTGSFDPYAAERDKIMRLLHEQYGFRIFKFEISEGFGLTGIHPDFSLSGEIMRPIWKYAQENGIRIVLDLGTRGTRGFQIEPLCETARRYPGIRFIVCHLLAPSFGDDKDVWKRDMERLAACPNLSFDISALPWNLRESYPFPTGADTARSAAEIVGVDRMIWGSDVPCVLTLSNYRRQYAFLEDSGRFTHAECELILGKNAEKIYCD